jgi:hypothetical protein
MTDVAFLLGEGKVRRISILLGLLTVWNWHSDRLTIVISFSRFNIKRVCAAQRRTKNNPGVCANGVYVKKSFFTALTFCGTSR